MISIKRSYTTRFFTSLAGMICFFLFALQINGQYLVPEDPSEDIKDPISIVARIVSSTSLCGREHSPFYKEEVGAASYKPLKNHAFYDQDSRPVIVPRLFTSLRGPPIV